MAQELTYIQKIERDAYLMIKEYGKIDAEKIAVSYAKDWIKEINKLEQYDIEKIKRMEDRKWYWFAVATTISELEEPTKTI